MGEGEPITVVAAAVVEELGVTPRRVRPLAVVEDIAALERVPMRMTVFLAELDHEPSPAAELAGLRWIDVRDPDGADLGGADPDGADLGGVDPDEVVLAPAVRRQALPLLRELPANPGSVP